MFFCKISRASATLAFILVGYYSSVLFAEVGLSGEEILARMNKAKESFYSYKITEKSKNSISTCHVFAKSRADGDLLWSEQTILRKTNVNDERISKIIHIIFGYEKEYIYYPDDNVAADISYQVQNMKSEAEKIKKELEGAMVTCELVKEVIYDNVECYDVRAITTKDSQTLAEEHFIIDKETFLPRFREETKHGLSFKIEYQDVRPEPELTLDFFNLPDGVIVKKATNQEEYQRVKQEIVTIRVPPPKEESLEEVKKKFIASLAPEQKALIDRSLNPPTVQKEVARIQAEYQAKKQAEFDEAMKHGEELRKKEGWRRTLFIVGFNLVVLSFILYGLRQKYLKRKNG